MSMPQSIRAQPATRTPERHRHPVRLRRLNVERVEQINHAMVRLTLTGPELEGFVSLGFDDHVKMFFPEPGEAEPVLPFVGPNGLEMPKDRKPIARDFTPRHHDAAKGELAIDFALHHDGPASNWARSVSTGDSAWIAGPRGSFVFPLDFDWHLLIADETGLPALARRLEELPAGTRAVALIEIDGAEDEIALETAAEATVAWVHRKGEPAGESRILQQSLKALTLPGGDFFTWIACESRIAKELRSFLIENRGANPKWMRASGYWRRGATGIHDHFDD
ncbi:siderophore-interacting protein [Nitratireductor sp. GCM10026969]|uniref:siderophore-interacting protein n=1 Tax=Nitratireductor sp. GCM10026969 TaxID=3252645 RepID=UPI0036117617